jgi:hypothetical protein
MTPRDLQIFFEDPAAPGPFGSVWAPHRLVWLTSPTRVGDLSSDFGITTHDPSGCGAQKYFVTFKITHGSKTR